MYVKLKQRCSVCKEPGHNSRSCGRSREEQPWLKRDGKRWSPRHVHPRGRMLVSVADVRHSKRHVAEPDPRPVDLVQQRPLTRGECAGGERPCPWVSCRYHLYLESRPGGILRLVFPDVEPWDIPETCALDVAEQRGGVTLEDVAMMTNVTRERVRQIEDRALLRLARRQDPR